MGSRREVVIVVYLRDTSDGVEDTSTMKYATVSVFVVDTVYCIAEEYTPVCFSVLARNSSLAQP